MSTLARYICNDECLVCGEAVRGRRFRFYIALVLVSAVFGWRHRNCARREVKR